MVTRENLDRESKLGYYTMAATWPKANSRILGDIGISMSAGYLSNLLIKTTRTSWKREVYAGLASSPWQHFDQTTRVAGVNYTTNIVCNPIYTVYFTTEKKDRLTVPGITKRARTQFLLNPLTYDLLETFQIPKKSEVFKVVAPRNWVQRFRF